MVLVRTQLRRSHYLINKLITGLILLMLPTMVHALDDDISFPKSRNKNSPFDVSVPVVAEISPELVTAGGVLTIRVFGRIRQNQHLYSVSKQGEFSPDPTKIVVNNRYLSTVSGVKESPTILIIDKAFDLALQVHKREFWISQRYQINPTAKPGVRQISGYLLYQICSHRICSLPLKSFFETSISISGH